MSLDFISQYLNSRLARYKFIFSFLFLLFWFSFPQILKNSLDRTTPASVLQSANICEFCSWYWHMQKTALEVNKCTATVPLPAASTQNNFTNDAVIIKPFFRWNSFVKSNMKITTMQNFILQANVLILTMHYWVNNEDCEFKYTHCKIFFMLRIWCTFNIMLRFIHFTFT